MLSPPASYLSLIFQGRHVRLVGGLHRIKTQRFGSDDYAARMKTSDGLEFYA